LLHDVGKLGIPDSILEKEGPLDESETATMKTHPEIGVTILKRGGHFRRELLGVLYHHERMDGSGYPHGLKADAIPIEARVVAVADTYDVLTTDRPYRQACGGREARRVVEAEAGTHLDPQVVVALMRALDREATSKDSSHKTRRPSLKTPGVKARLADKFTVYH
jgi:HD-GYP domain-containing protein (c-di-GMP phosphodiesterase class II)